MLPPPGVARAVNTKARPDKRRRRVRPTVLRMTFLVPTREQAHAGLRAIKTTLDAGGGLSEAHREGLAAIQKHLLRTDFDVDSLAPITPGELASVVVDPALREQLVSALVTSAMLSEHVDPRHADTVDGFAAALLVSPAAVRQLRSLAEESYWRLRIDVIRQGPGPDGMRKLYEQGGALSVVKNVLGFAGLIENPEIAERYRALSGYPEGTLGKALFDFYSKRGYKFPGEKGGAPEALLGHDLSHILGGYDTDILSEAKVLAFTAGYRREKVFGPLIFILVQGQHGVRLTPLAEAYTGLLSSSHVVPAMVEAFARGSRMNVDLMGDWDFWAVIDQPVSELRRRYGIDEPAAAA
jgi:hypothetical protein